jgi:hypothetical protein
VTGRGFGRAEAEYMLWFHGEGGPEPGDFFKHIVEAVARADPQNRARLAQAFPRVVAAHAFFHSNPVAATREIAEAKIGDGSIDAVTPLGSTTEIYGDRVTVTMVDGTDVTCDIEQIGHLRHSWRGVTELWVATHQPELERRRAALEEQLEAAGWFSQSVGGGVVDWVHADLEDSMVSIPHEVRVGWLARLEEAEARVAALDS